ncbi:hypothetical protein niasHT_009217 [Heterodera trifolii]|uniref:Battenin n=1 Tax=Heterodera trifolii TaxID=157864 RepID=A0ABD2LYT3_9BILA
MLNAADGQKGAAQWRNVLAFCVLGLCNKLALPLLISASEDIIKMHNISNNVKLCQNATSSSSTIPTNSQCVPDLGKPRCETLMSTGAVLLANTLPSLTIKLTVSFFMNRIPFSFRHFLVCSLQAACFLLVGFSTTTTMAFAGVAFGSAAAGFGEICFLALSSFYDSSTLLAWFFGTGASGIVSSVTYSALTEPKLFGTSPQKVILSMLIIPTVYFLTYWLLLVHSPLMHKAQLLQPSSWIVPAIRRPNYSGQVYIIENAISDSKNGTTNGGTHEFTFLQKLKMIKPLLRYMVPICIVYFLDNLINSGLLQHVKFDCAHSFGLSLASQFRWLQTFHLVGLFLSRLSAIFVEMPSLIFYSLPFLMLANLAIFFGQALFSFIPHILFVFVTIFIVGMVNGACCNFFGKIHQQASPMAREFKMTVISLADTSGVAMAGFLSILTHNSICQLYPIIYP